MKKIIALTLIAIGILTASPVVASDISSVLYSAVMRASNNSTATDNASVTFSANTSALIDAGLLNSTATDATVRNSAGADAKFMPGIGSNPWVVMFGTVPANASKDYYLYTDTVTGGAMRYFPGNNGMATTDDTSLELVREFTITQSGYINTDNSTTNMALISKGSVAANASFATYLSGAGNITSTIRYVPDNYTVNQTEVDAAGHLTLTTKRATATGVTGQEDVYIYRDFGASHFDDLNITFEIYTASTTTSTAFGGIAISNTIDDRTGFAATDISLTTHKNGTCEFYLARGNAVATDVVVLPFDTLYYCSLQRAKGADTVYCKIYSDAARTTLLDTLSVAGFGTTQYRYAFGFVNANTAVAAQQWNGYVQNFSPNLTVDVTASTSSGEHTVTTHMESPFIGIGIDVTDNLTPVSTNLTLNLPLWQTECNASNTDTFTSIDNYEHTCTVTGATWTSDGYSFDGNDFINTSAPVDIDTALTIIGWVKPTFGANMEIVDCRSAAVSGWGMTLLANGRLYSRINGLSTQLTEASPSLIDGAWGHVAITYTGVTNNIVGYTNTNLVKTTAVTGNIVTPVNNLYIGRYSGGATEYFVGVISDVRIYDRAFTQDEVTRDYNATKWKYLGGEPERQTYSTTANVTDTSANWTSCLNNVMPYMEYQEVSVNGTQVQYVDWEYGTTFTDSSGYGNDATPTFRTTSSDSDVSGEMINFEPIELATATDIAGEWPTIMTAAPDQPSTMYTENTTPGFFFAPIITLMASYSGGQIPASMIYYLMCFTTILLAGMFSFFIIADKGKQAALLLKMIVMGALMVFYAMPGLNVYGFYVCIYYFMWCFGIMVLSKSYGW